MATAAAGRRAAGPPGRRAAGRPAGRPAGERAGLVDFYSYKTPSTQLQDSLGSTLYTSPNKKTVNKQNNRLQ